MTYFVLDAEAIPTFAEGLARHSDVGSSFRIAEYSQLASRTELPGGRYVFLGLAYSWPARIARLRSIAEKLAVSGSEIWNSPTARNEESRLELARAANPGLHVARAIGVEQPEFPCRLWAADAGRDLESELLESEAEYREVLLDWVLRGTEPELLFRVTGSISAAEDREICFRVGNAFIRHDGTHVGKSQSALLADLTMCGPQFARIEFRLDAGGTVKLLRWDDRGSAFLGERGLPSAAVRLVLKTLELPHA